jgi:hypothetical protein
MATTITNDPLVPLRGSQKSKVLIGKDFMIFGLVDYFCRAALASTISTSVIN